MEDIVIRPTLILFLILGLPLVHAQTVLPSTPSASPAAAANASGTVLIVPASGEVKMANDEAYLTFVVEEQDKDQVAASSRVNRRMKEGIELIQRLDPQASVATGGYFTYPVYAEDNGRSSKAGQPVAWRVGQSLTVTTKNLGSLPQTVARAQEKLALQSLHFGLSEAARRKLDHQVMEDAYRRLHQRIESMAGIMGRKASSAHLEQVDLAGGEMVRPYAANRMEMSVKDSSSSVEAPRFAPGETPVQMNITARVRFY
jgi:predicted secreted protein